MPIFLDIHKIPTTEKKIDEIVNQQEDESQVTHINILFNREADLCYFLLQASSKEAIEKYHSKINMKCDFIYQVTMAK